MKLILGTFVYFFSVIASAQLLDYPRYSDIPSVYNVTESYHKYGIGYTNYYINGGQPILQKELVLKMYTPDTSNSPGKKRAVLIMIPGGGRDGCNSNSCICVFTGPNAQDNKDKADACVLRHQTTLYEMCTSKTTNDGTEGANNDQRNLSYECNNFFETNYSTAMSYAKRGFVVLSLNTRYQYHNYHITKHEDDGPASANINKWRNPTNPSDPLYNKLAAHLEPLEADIKRAIRWISKNADTSVIDLNNRDNTIDNTINPNVDPENIFIYGASGGGKMASVAAITPVDLVKTDDPEHMNPTNTQLYNFEVTNNHLNTPQRPLRGAIISNGDTQGKKILNYIDSSTGAFMFWHGTKDRSILHGTAETIEEKCDDVGCVSEFYSIDSQPHGVGSKPFHKSTDGSPSHQPGIVEMGYDFIVNRLTSTSLPTLSINGTNSGVKEDDGMATITISLDAPLNSGEEVKFVAYATQMREVMGDDTSNGTYQYVIEHVANDQDGIPTGPIISTGPIIYAYNDGAAWEDSTNENNNYSGTPAIINYADYFTQDFETKYEQLSIEHPDTTASFSVPISADNRVEKNECFKVRIVNPNGAVLGNSVETITILDDDFTTNNTVTDPTIPVPCENNEVSTEPQISINSLTVTEGDDAILVISLSEPNPSTQDIEVDFLTTNGSAESGFDYVARSGKIVFEPGDITKTRTVTTLQDNEVELTEAFTMQLSSPVNATIVQEIGTVTIIDDDEPIVTDPVLSFQSKSVSETDTDDPRFIAIVADKDIPVGTQFAINYKTTPGTANNSGENDYISVDSTTTVTAQGTSGQNVPANTPLKHIPITIIGDDEFEPNETFSIEIVSVVSGATPGLPATVTILNDDEEPVNAVPVLTVYDKNVSEGSPNGDIAYIKVTSDIELETDLVINYKTKVGLGPTGASSSDFVWTDSSVTMVTGTDTKYIPITIINDTDGSPEDSLNETFTVEFTLNDPADASFNLGDNIATVTIADDDQ